MEKLVYHSIPNLYDCKATFRYNLALLRKHIFPFIWVWVVQRQRPAMEKLSIKLDPTWLQVTTYGLHHRSQNALPCSNEWGKTWICDHFGNQVHHCTSTTSHCCKNHENTLLCEQNTVGSLISFSILILPSCDIRQIVSHIACKHCKWIQYFSI